MVTNTVLPVKSTYIIDKNIFYDLIIIYLEK